MYILNELANTGVSKLTVPLPSPEIEPMTEPLEDTEIITEPRLLTTLHLKPVIFTGVVKL